MKKQVLNVRYILLAQLDSARSRSGSTRLEAFFIQIKLNSTQPVGIYDKIVQIVAGKQTSRNMGTIFMTFRHTQ